VLVVVAFVGGVPVRAVDIVHMICVRDGYVAAARSMVMAVVVVREVGERVLVVVAFVPGVGVAVMDVIGVVLMGRTGVAAVRPVGVGMDMGVISGVGHLPLLPMVWLSLRAVVDGVGDDVRHVLVGQGVDGLSPLAFDRDQARPAQHPQMLGDQWLAHPEPLHQFMDEPGLPSQLGHDRQPGRSGQHPQQLSRRLVTLGSLRHHNI
jgi:hypothetical protein